MAGTLTATVPTFSQAAQPPTGGIWSPDRRALSIGLVLTITLVAFESLAVSTVMPSPPTKYAEPSRPPKRW